jgi:hypothetical protein
MAKADPVELLEKWRTAEQKFRELADAALRDGAVDKDSAVALTKLRVKADRRMQEYFDRVLR